MKPDDSQSQFPLLKIDRRSVADLQTRGIEVETVGFHRLFNGSALVTLEGSQEIKQRIVELLRQCEDSESVANLANAYANLAKAEAATFKVMGESQAPESKTQRARKSVAKGAIMGPAIEVQAQAPKHGGD